MFSPPLIQDMAIVWVTLFNLFCYWALKLWDRVQTIPFKIVSKAFRGTVGPLFRMSNFCFCGGPIVRGGPKIKEGATFPASIVCLSLSRLLKQRRAKIVFPVYGFRFEQQGPSKRFSARALRTLSQGKLPMDLQSAACPNMLGLFRGDEGSIGVLSPQNAESYAK